MSRGTDLLRHDFAAVLNGMRRRPFVPLMAIAMLAVAIAANVAVFTVISRTLLRPLHFERPDQVVYVTTTHVQPDHSEVDQPSNDLEFMRWKMNATAFSGIEAFKPLSMTVTGSGDPESINGSFVSGGFFRLFGVRPLLGRDFTTADDVPHSHSAMISYGLWQRRFGGSKGVLSQKITVDGISYDVIGVVPAGFEIPTFQNDVYIPEGLSSSHLPNPKSWNYSVVGRVRDGIPLAQAQAEVRRISAQLGREFPDSEKDESARLRSLRDFAYGDQRASLLVLAIAVLLVQLLGCVNVANLLLAQNNDERGVMALRLVLGANRWHLMRMRLMQGTLIAVGGAIAGRVLAGYVLGFVLKSEAALAEPVESAWTVPLFLVVVVVVTTLVISIVPAFREAGAGLATLLNEGSQRASSSVRSTRARELFVIAQLALAVPLLLGATVAVRHFEQLRQTSLGYDPDHVFTGQVILGPKYDKAARAAFVAEIEKRLRALPGVVDAAVTTNLWLRTQTAGTFAATDRYPEYVSMSLRRCSPDYFRTMKIPLLRGREFTGSDSPDAPPVAIVSAALARRFWPGEDPIGKRIRRKPPLPWMSIVGIAPDVRDEGIDGDPAPTLYVPFAQATGIYVSLAVRSRGESASVRDAVRRAVWSLDRTLTPSAEKPLRELTDAMLDPERLQATLLTGFAVVALLLAASGIYSITAYTVSQRTREIGVRLAFGATPKVVANELLRRAARSTAMGLAAGVAIAFAAQRVESLVAYGASHFGFVQATAVCAILFASAIAATFVPSLRARRVQPAALLRDG